MTIDRCRALLAFVLIVLASPVFAQPFPIRSVSPLGDDASLTATAVDPQGNAFLIWGVIGPNHLLALRASRYVASTDTWSPPVTLPQSIGSTTVVAGVQIATDPAGNAIAVWRVGASGTTLGNIMATNYSVASDTWSPATLLSDRGEFSLPRVALDAAGNGLVVWEFGNRLHSTRYSSSSGWSSATPSDSNLETHPFVGFDANGNALVTFARIESGGGLGLYAKRFPAGSATGGVAERVAETTAVLSVTNPETAMAMDPQGNALLLWTFWSQKTEAVRFNAASGLWSAVERVWTRIDGVDGTACGPNADADAHGNFVVVWWTNCGSSVRRARRHDGIPRALPHGARS